jgi:plastocyanin
MNARLTPMLGAFVLAAVALAGCNGGGGYGSNPMAPSLTSSPMPAPGAATLTIRIVGRSGSQSFTPNPSSIVAGQTVAFYNADSVVHRIVADGGAFDTGNVNPGATSAPVTISSAGVYGYHSATYPAAVGTVNVTSQ